jgi:type IV fimbrial biogenesis protein FimT
MTRRHRGRTMAGMMRAYSRVGSGLYGAKERGFTLVEAMVVVCIAAVIASLAAPAFTEMMDAHRRISAVNRLVASLHLARSEAIKRNGRVVLCKSPDLAACAGKGGWDQGWIVFHDLNNNAQLDAGEWLLLQQGPLAPGLHLSGNRPVASYVSYGAVGRARLTSGAFQAGAFTVCPGNGTTANIRKVILSPTGRPRTVAGVAADCP